CGLPTGKNSADVIARLTDVDDDQFRSAMAECMTAHPTPGWTAQQFRMVISGDEAHRYLIHDRDTIYSIGVDRTLDALGLKVLKTPVHAPQANAFCERVIARFAANASTSS